MLVSNSSPDVYIEEEKRINAQAESFYLFLKTCVFTDAGWRIMEFVSRHNTAYIFSGIIRDFLTGQIGKVRDIDIVVKSNDNLERLFYLLKDSIIQKNQFGGVKITIGSLVIDAWQLRNTWGIIQKKSKDTPENLLETAFFNFSAIAFDLQKRKFLVSEEFCRFNLSNKLDYVYEVNPNIPLCIVNTLYYRQKFGFAISTRLMEWVNRHYKVNFDYEPVQIRHFGHVVFDNRTINELIRYISNEKNRLDEIPF